MPVLLDNIIFALQQTGGISVYWSELLSRLLVDGDVRLFERPEAIRNIQRKNMIIPDGIIMPEPAFPPLQMARYLPVNPEIAPQTIFHSSYYRLVRKQGVLNIVTVHDFTYEYFSAGLRRMVHSLQKRNAISSADRIICYSEHTRQDLLRFYPETDPAMVNIIPLAAGLEFKPVDSTIPRPVCLEGLKGSRYLVYVGDRSPYKHFSVAVESTQHFSDTMLVIVGGRSLSPEEKRSLDAQLPGRYLHLQGLSSNDLNLVYNHAWCLLYPSAYEGFGIPPLEAMQAGCPVIAVHAASLPEVCGEAALLASKPSVEEFIALIRSLDKIEHRAERKAAGIHRATAFSWNTTYAKTRLCYQDALAYQRKKN